MHPLQILTMAELHRRELHDRARSARAHPRRALDAARRARAGRPRGRRS